MQRILGAVLALGLGLFAGHRAQADITLPDGPGRDLVYARCQTCHDLQYVVESEGLPKAAWSDLLVTMYGYGLRIPDDEKTKIAAYLSTYLGPNPPKAAAPVPADAPAADGAKVFAANCTACHRAQGEGLKGAFPPLSGNPDLFLDRLFPAHVLLHGMTGPITVKGARFNGAMPSFAHLKDAEIAAVVAYMRGAWDNAGARPAGMAPLTAADVSQLRDETLTAKAVHKLRAKLKGGG